MRRSGGKKGPSSREIEKTPTGIRGLDEITGGGLPRGRPTLVCGAAGCGKTLLAIEFLVRGATLHGEPGVFMTFEESEAELTENVRSLGFDLDDLRAKRKLAIDYVPVDRSEIAETGNYDLEGLFIRLGHAIDSVGARRVVLDTIENLFGYLSNTAVLRSELRRLFGWLKAKGVTAIITAERGDGTLTRHGIEEYVSDCVILLDHRVTEQLSTRRLRVVKYRGSVHGTNEFPFIIDRTGISVLPITSIGLEHDASNERISTGVPQLDAMLSGKGYYRGSSILVMGSAGTGKTSLAAHFVDASCRRGERCLYFSFEESERQMVRNMRSIGIDLDRWIRKGLLAFHASRPSLHGLESHLVMVHRLVNEFAPRNIVVDPLSSLTAAGSSSQVQAMLLRLVDYLKSAEITAFFTALSDGAEGMQRSELEISSVIDTWLRVRDLEVGEVRKRGLYVLKSRGMAHSNRVREFLLTDAGIELIEPGGVAGSNLHPPTRGRSRTARK